MMDQHQKRYSRGCSITLVTNEPTLVTLLFGTAIPTSPNNFCNCFHTCYIENIHLQVSYHHLLYIILLLRIPHTFVDNAHA